MDINGDFYFICSTWGSWRVKSSCTKKCAKAGIKLFLIPPAWSFPWLIKAILKMLFKCSIWQTKPFHWGLPSWGRGGPGSLVFLSQSVACFVGKNVAVALSRPCIKKYCPFFCQFLLAVGVLENDCRLILRSCHLSAKLLGRPLHHTPRNKSLREKCND